MQKELPKNLGRIAPFMFTPQSVQEESAGGGLLSIGCRNASEIRTLLAPLRAQLSVTRFECSRAANWIIIIRSNDANICHKIILTSYLVLSVSIVIQNRINIGKLPNVCRIIRDTNSRYNTFLDCKLCDCVKTGAIESCGLGGWAFSGCPSNSPRHKSCRREVSEFFRCALTRPFATFRFLSRDFSIVRDIVYRLVVIIAADSIFASHGTAFTHPRLSISTLRARMRRTCVGKRRESSSALSRTGTRWEYITRRIWPGYVPDSLVYNLGRCRFDADYRSLELKIVVARRPRLRIVRIVTTRRSA